MAAAFGILQFAQKVGVFPKKPAAVDPSEGQSVWGEKRGKKVIGALGGPIPFWKGLLACPCHPRATDGTSV